MAGTCKFCAGPIPTTRGKRAGFCSRICRDKWNSSEGHELSQQANAVARRQKKAINLAEQKADESLRRYLDEKTALSRIHLEEKIGKRALTENKSRQVMLIRPELEKE